MKIYLISGNSYIQINEQINEIVGNSKNVTTFDMNVNTIDEVLIEAGYFSMFNETKYIIIRNALFFGSAKISEKDSSLLENYLEKPSDLAVLIFICPENLDLRKKLTKLIKTKYSLINIPPLKNYEIEKKIQTYLTKEGYKIDENSIKYIVSNSLNNYDIVISEVQKLILYYEKNSYIKYNDVIHIVSTSINTNNFLFVDAVVNNDLKTALHLFNDLKIMKVEPSILLSLLARDFRIMLNLKILIQAKKQEYQIMQELGLADWQLSKYMQKVFPYKKRELEEILHKLAKMDLDIKKGKIDRFMALELFILDICE